MMTFCGKCGTENPETEQYCYRCGARLNMGCPRPVPEQEPRPVPEVQARCAPYDDDRRRNLLYAIVAMSLISFAIGAYALFMFQIELEGSLGVKHEYVTFYELATNGWTDQYTVTFWIMTATLVLSLLLPASLALGALMAIVGYKTILVDSVPIGLGFYAGMGATNTSSLIAIGILLVILGILHAYLYNQYVNRYLKT